MIIRDSLGSAPIIADLRRVLNDTGSSHSPIYGFALDGYPVHGPYQSEGILAQSCWQFRNYDRASITGCVDSKRSCLLRDSLDYKKVNYFF